MAAPVDLSQDIHALKPGMIALRRELHQHPELAFEEEWTAATLAGRMLALGLAVQDGIGGTGVLAVLEGERPGRTLLIRADIDALPMEDTTGREYASKLPNRNHACGHDAHSAVVAGVAEVLARHRDSIAGRIAFVFQPADEPMRGAKRMIKDGLLERVKPDMSLSLPVLPMANAGQVVVQSGPIWASRDELTLKVSGPSASVGDPATFDFPRTAAQVTSALYDLVEHEGKSTEKATFRVRSLQAEQAAQRVIGRANIIKNWRSPFSDDFGLFMAAAPGCLMLLGTANPEKGITEIWHRIRVNTICIGLVRSAQIARRAKGDLEAHYAELAKQRVPLGRVAHASEFADLFAFLVSERASYITGASVNFDGGSGMTV